MLRKICVVAIACLVLGACQKPNAAATTAALKATLAAAQTTSPKLASAINTVDAKIAKASQQVAAYCLVMRTALVGVSLFGSANGAVAGARTVVADFCDNPPSDPVSALALIQATITDLKAQGITATSVQKLSLQQDRYAAKRLMRLHLAAQRVR